MDSKKNSNTTKNNEKLFHQLTPIFIQIAALSFFINLLMLTIPLYMMQVFDRVVPTQHLETLFFLTLIAGGAVLVYGILETIRSRFLIRTGSWISTKIKPTVLYACLHSPAKGLNVGKRPLEEVDTLKSILTSPASLAMLDLPWFPIFIGVIWMIHPALGIAALCSGAFLFLISGLSHFLVHKRIPQVRDLLIKGDQFATAAIQGTTSVLAMAMWPDVIRNWKSLQTVPAYQTTKIEEVTATFSAVIKAVRMFIQVALLGFGAYLAVKGEITMGSIIAVSILSGRALAPVDILVGSWRQILHAREALTYLKQFLDQNKQPDDKISLPAPTGHVQVQNASFTLPGMKKFLLNQISFTLNAGETLAIIGASGAGKSTLCKAILGYHSLAGGNIRLDGADISRWRPEDIAPYIGYMPQRAEFFPGSVRDNISRFQECADQEVIEAAKLTGLHEIILALPLGYETQLDADGSPLSGGQAQRVGLARALFQKPRFLILDEPNANLDGAGTGALISALNTAQDWGATIVMVVHRQNMLQGIDKILALRDGRIELFGPAAQVLEKLSKASAA